MTLITAVTMGSGIDLVLSGSYPTRVAVLLLWIAKINAPLPMTLESAPPSEKACTTPEVLANLTILSRLV